MSSPISRRPPRSFHSRGDRIEHVVERGRRGRPVRRTGFLEHRLHFPPGRVTGRLEALRVDPRLPEEPLAAGHGLLRPAGLDLRGRPIRSLVGRGVPFEAPRLRVKKARLAGAGRRYEVPRDRIDGHDVVAVHLRRSQPEALRPRRGPRPRGQRLGTGRRGKAVVLAYEEHRQPVHRRPVEPFEERPPVHRAVAEDADHDAVVPDAGSAEPDPVRGAGRDEDVGPDHPVRPEHAHPEVRDVHGAALAAAHPPFTPEQLAHHGAGVRTLGEGVAVPAMVGKEKV